MTEFENKDFGGEAAADEAVSTDTIDSPAFGSIEKETVSPDQPDSLYAEGPVNTDTSSEELSETVEVAEAEEPEYEQDAEPVLNEPKNSAFGPSADEIAETLRWQRQNAIKVIAQSQQGRGVPVEVLTRQAEDLILWLDGEITADELATYNSEV